MTVAQIQKIIDAFQEKSYLSGVRDNLTLAQIDISRPFAVDNVILCTTEEARRRRRWDSEKVQNAKRIPEIRVASS
jgi:hypothetical protein